jgi:trans-aconitate 2-methyltransferase
VSQDAWDPQQYERFQAERQQPFFDLVALVQRRPGMRVVDLGCGTGTLTRELHLAVAAQETVGIDNSPAMLARATPLAMAGLRFEPGDIAEFSAAGAYDLVFSNAALHWVPDQATLLRRLTGALKPGGQLAVQVPANHDDAAHRVAVELAAEPPFTERLAASTSPRAGVLTPREYALLLDRLGYAEQHVRLQVYAHRLASREEVVEWAQGTVLTPYRSRLGEELYTRFLEAYRSRLLPQLEDRRPYLFPFQRILFWAGR